MPGDASGGTREDERCPARGMQDALMRDEAVVVPLNRSKVIHAQLREFAAMSALSGSWLVILALAMPSALLWWLAGLVVTVSLCVIASMSEALPALRHGWPAVVLEPAGISILGGGRVHWHVISGVGHHGRARGRIGRPAPERRDERLAGSTYRGSPAPVHGCVRRASVSVRLHQPSP